MKRLVLGLLICFMLVPVSALAVPTLQLYAEGATYDPETETWVQEVMPGEEFSLYVVGAKQPSWVEYIDNVKLFIAIPDGTGDYPNAWDPNGIVNITSAAGETTNIDLTLDASTALYGVPDLGDGDLAPHGVYPTYYWEIELPDLLVSTAGELVYNYVDDPGLTSPVSGDIQYYDVSFTGFDLIHFDLVGRYLGEQHKARYTFAPFSHDAEGFIIPEPATLTLMGLGLAGAALGSMRRRKKRA